MKKIISITLMMCLLLSTTGFAETFTLRGGIQFGMTMDEVIESEKNIGSEPTASEYNGGYSAGEKKWSVVVKPELLAGYKDGKITYLFDEDNLTSCFYYFDMPDKKANETTATDMFNSLCAKLEGKYGSPLAEGEMYIDFAASSDDLYDWCFRQDPSEFSLVDSSQWITEDDDGFVQIVIMHMNYHVAWVKLYGSLVQISYSTVTADEYNKTMEEAQRKTKSADDDL